MLEYVLVVSRYITEAESKKNNLRQCIIAVVPGQSHKKIQKLETLETELVGKEEL